MGWDVCVCVYLCDGGLCGRVGEVERSAVHCGKCFYWNSQLSSGKSGNSIAFNVAPQ